MAATAKPVPDEARRWWETFSNGFTVDQEKGEGEEPEVELGSGSDSDSNSGFERIVPAAAEEEEEQNVEEQGSAAARHREEEEVPGDGGSVQLQAGPPLTGRETEATATHDEPRATGAEVQGEKGEHIAEDNHDQTGGGLLLQGRAREAAATHSKLQPTTTGTESSDKKCSRYKKDHVVAAEGENADMAARESDGKRMAVAQAPVEVPTSSGGADCYCNGKYVSEDSYAQIGIGLLQGRERESTDHQVVEEGENAGMAASGSDNKMMMAAQAPVDEPRSGANTKRHCDVGCCSNAEEEVPGDCYDQVQRGLLIGRKRKATATHAEPQATGTEIQELKDHEQEVSGDCYVQLQGGLLGRKRKAIVTHVEPQTSGKEIQGEKYHGEYASDDNFIQTGVGLQGRKREANTTPRKQQRTTGHAANAQGEHLRAENEMLRQQLMRKMEELEAEKIRRLKLELNLESKEFECLEKQNEELRVKNECSRKDRKATKKPKAVL